MLASQFFSLAHAEQVFQMQSVAAETSASAASICRSSPAVPTEIRPVGKPGGRASSISADSPEDKCRWRWTGGGRRQSGDKGVEGRGGGVEEWRGCS